MLPPLSVQKQKKQKQKIEKGGGEEKEKELEYYIFPGLGTAWSSISSLHVCEVVFFIISFC